MLVFDLALARFVPREDIPEPEPGPGPKPGPVIIQKPNNGDGTYSFIYGGIPVTVEVEFAPIQTGGWNPFIDVKASDWFQTT